MIGKYEEAIVDRKLELLYHIPVCEELKWCILPIDIFNISLHCLRVGFSCMDLHFIKKYFNYIMHIFNTSNKARGRTK
jgi:hypothetical protein